MDAAKQGAWTATQAVEQPRQENAPPRLPWPVFRSLKQDSFTRGGGPRGGGASRGNGSWSLPDSPEERSSREIQRKMEDEARKRHEYERRRAEEERRRRTAGPEPVFQGFTPGGGSRGGGASRDNGSWSLPDSSEERSNREIQREMEDKARKRHEYERRWAEEERRRRAAGPEPAFQGFTHGGGSRGGGASRGNDPWGQAEQSPFIRGGISGGGGARRGGSPWEQVAYPPDGAGSGGPEQELTEEASPEREEEAEQEEKSVSLPPVRQLLAKIAGAAGAGIAGAAGAVNAGIQAAGAAGRIAETFLRPKGVSDWDWSWRESAAQDAKNDLEKSAALYNVGQAKLDAAQRISEELNRKVVFDGTLPVDKTGVIDPETGTIRLNARVGGPENLRDNAVQLLEEQPKTGLDSSGSPGYNAGEEGLFQDTAGAGGNGLNKQLMNELAESGVKYNADDVVMITKNADGKLLWLEKGGDSAGLKHIIDRHTADFTAKGINDIPKFLNEVLKRKAAKVGMGAKGPFEEYIVNGTRYRVAYGNNGYIVSFFPIKLR